ncbi:MAG: two-component sensor histidine kinase [Comamonadaceae bacterium SCN 68-20]|nr:MAG: two-component sensor histidine kinase [Comamonadaceae bacterium SCN 68-20]
MSAGSRWLPASLFGRLMLVLASGLMLAQLLSAAINVAERDRLLARSFGLQPAQRIADVVKLLDGLGPAERERVVAVFGVPPLVLSLHDAPAIADTADRAAAASLRGAMFAAQLRAALGDARATRIETRAGFMPGPAASGRGPREGMQGLGMGNGMGLGPSMMRERQGPWGHGAGAAMFRTEVQLRDGRWARFDTELPAAPDALPWRLVATLAVLLVAMLALSWVAVRWVVRPLHVLAQAAQSLGEDLGRPPLPEDGPREVRQAAQAFNTMQRRLASFIDERTRMLTALSHDLKTPLTRMRLRTELLDDDDARTRFAADLQEMEAMVTQTLDFMRGLGGHEARTPVDIDALLASLQSDNEAMGRAVAIEGRASAAFVGVPSLLRRALGNLVDNAVLYGGGATLRVDDTPGRLTLHVLDTGPGIPEAELERVFDPFYRLEASRNRATGGTGLGLGIARSIARLHGGDVVLRNRPGGGLDAALELPRA